MNNIGFPGLGIEAMEIDPIAFRVPLLDLPIAWYGIFVTLGVLSGIFYAFWRGQKNCGVSVDDMIDVAIFSIPAAIIGAKVYYIIFSDQPVGGFVEIFTDFGRGLAIYGAIIFAFITAFTVCKIKKLSFLKVFDAGAPAIMLGQIIGRWGNFTNMEAYGIPTDLPWRMSVQSMRIRYAEVHPIFLYESLWNLVGFIIINLIFKKKKIDGQIFLIYITWYGFGRMIIEHIRGGDVLTLGIFRVSQLVGFLCFVIGTVLIIMMLSKIKEMKLESAVYEGVYSKAQAELADDDGEDIKDIDDSAKEKDGESKEEKPDEETEDNEK
jgi:phosphatidylglycerol:prolipoprotein diacylglycerol transferase